MKKNAISILGATIFLLAFSMLPASCGGGGDTADSSSSGTTEKPKSMVADEQQPIEVSEDGTTVTVRLTGDDMMKYNLNKIEVKEGQKIKLELAHIGKMAKEAMGHNFVLLKPGVALEAFANAAALAKDTDYIPEGQKDDILVHTIMIGGGQSTSIEFDAPAKGSYKFLCSFPAHYINMQGDFVVN